MVALNFNAAEFTRQQFLDAVKEFLEEYAFDKMGEEEMLTYFSSFYRFKIGKPMPCNKRPIAIR